MSDFSKKTVLLGGAVCAAVLLTACGKVSNKIAKEAQNATDSASSKMEQTLKVDGYKYTLADGPKGCLDAYKEKIGSDFKLLKFNTFYVLPESIDSSIVKSYKDANPGDMKTCDITIQDPADEKKAVAYRMDTKTGEIQGPNPVELRVSGDAESFRLSDHVYPVASIEYAAINQNIDSLKPKIEEKYSGYQVSGIRMDGNLSTGEPQILVHIDGKLKANDIAKNILVTLSPDGKKILSNSFK